MGVYKNALPGSQLPLADLPRRAQSVILHTRYATQGSHRDNRNNHPVISPEGSIALVHNGVISNDWQFRAESKYYEGEFEGLAAVDTAVIPALIERYGLKKAVGLIEGYAAIAFLDMDSADKDTLHLARLDYSPVHFTWLTDGSFVFASTEETLEAALFMSGLDHGYIWSLPEETYVTVRGGVILSKEGGYKMQEDWYTRRRFANATSGGHGTSTGTVGSEAITTGGYNAYGIGSSFGNVEFDDSDESEGLSWEDDAAIRNGATIKHNADGSTTLSWENDYRSTQKQFTTNADDIAMAYANESNEPAGVWVAGKDGALVRKTDMNDNDVMTFYVTMDDGDIETFDSLDDLEKQLGWMANLTMGTAPRFSDATPKMKWTNFVADMGHITEADGMVSWLSDLANVDAFESPAVRNLDYIREGLIMLMLETSI